MRVGPSNYSHPSKRPLHVLMDRQLPDRIERDEFLDNAMRAAGVPLLRISTAPGYDDVALRVAIEDAIVR